MANTKLVDSSSKGGNRCVRLLHAATVIQFISLVHAAGWQSTIVVSLYYNTSSNCQVHLLLPLCFLQGKTFLFMPKLPEAYGVWMGPIQGPDYYKVCHLDSAAAVADAGHAQHAGGASHLHLLQIMVATALATCLCDPCRCVVQHWHEGSCT